MAPFPSELRAGSEVFSSDGHKLGELRRAVLRRGDLSLSHIVVDIGFLRSGHKLWEGGLGLDYDRIVPAEAIANIADSRVELSLTAAQFKDLPEYTEEAFELAHDLTPGEFDVPDLINEGARLAAALSGMPNFWLVQRLNKPLDEVDIKEGTPVWRQEPHEKLGEVRRLLFDEQTGRLVALVIRRGFIFSHDVILPARYISELLDDIVRVEIGDRELAQLKAYEQHG